jgi:VanZ family protein
MLEKPRDIAGEALSWLPWAFLLYLAFVVYGSLLPFEPRPPPTAGAWEAFLRLPYLQLGVASRADWVANLLLYIPLGFLAVGTAQGRAAPNPVHGLAALIVVGAVAVGVEYAQIFFAPRTVSMNDLVAEWLGAAVGIVLWYAARERLGRLLAEMRGHGDRALRAAILLYLAAYLVLAVFPFDFLVSVDELRWRLSTDTWGLVVAPVAGGGIVRRVLQLLVDVAAMVPLGFLVASTGTAGRHDAMRRAAIAGVAFGLLIEGLQFFTASGISQGASVVARAGGAVLGVWLAARAPGWLRQPVPRWAATAVLVALPLYGLVLAALNGWFAESWLGFGEAVARLKPEAFLPFYYHYFTTELEAMQSLVANALMYAPVGIGYWVWATARRSWSSAVTPALLAAGLAAVVEVGKFFVPAKHADPTNVLIAAVAAAFAFLVVRRVWRDTGLRPTEGEGLDRIHPGPQVGAPADSAGGALAPSTRFVWPSGWADRARFVTGAILLGAVAVVLVRFPVWPLPLGVALAAYAFALWRKPSAWLVVVPAALPALDLATVSGWYFVDELDLVLLVMVGVALLRPADGVRWVPLPRRATVLLTAFAIAYAIAVLRGLLPLSPLDLNALSNPYGSYETLRVAKGVIWAFALLPLLQRAFASPEESGRHLVTGMALGLLLAGAAVLHERLVFTGLFDFSADFRATGAFSGMHTGGSQIEAYLVMALPFALLALTQRRLWYVRVLGLAALVAGSYALLVTFARGGYAAGAVGLTITALGLLVAQRHSRRGGRSSGRLAATAVTGGIVVLLVAAAVTGPYMAGRFAGTTGDLQTRWNHWGDAVAMMDEGLATSLFGMGVGRFPETYFWKTEKGDRPGTFAFLEEKGNRFLRLGAGDPLYLRQKVALQPETSYRLSLDARSDEPGMQFNVFLCEQTLLYSGRCKAQSFSTGQPLPAGQSFAAVPSLTKGHGGNGWQPLEAVVDSGEVGTGSRLAQRPVYLGLNFPAGEAAVDLDNVKLVSPAGENLLRNGDFERGFDYWFFAADGHLAWHIKSHWAAVLFEQGWLGVLALAILLAYAGVRLGKLIMKGSRVSVGIFAALSALLVVGIFDSPFDFPRIALLFFLLLFAGIIRSGTRATPSR